MTKDEALKKIIEMWEYGDFLDSSSGLDEFDEAIQACKEALEQPAQHK